MQATAVAPFDDLADRQPVHAQVAGIDLVIVRFDGAVSVLYGRCLHRGALMADGHVDGDNLICGVHDWDYRLDTGVSAYDNKEALRKFSAWVEQGTVWVDADEIAEWGRAHPQPFDRTIYLGQYADTGHGTAEEPHNALIRRYARDGLSKTGHHGAVEAMGVPRDSLPTWDDLQILPAQLHRPPLLDEHPVGTDVVIGPNAKRPLRLAIPLLVSDMSFGALSASAKVALAGACLVRPPRKLGPRGPQRTRRLYGRVLVSPPSTGSACPFTYDDSSLARNSAAAAISCGRP
jgi:methylamine---glutamate N-methyltransferase subunit C